MSSLKIITICIVSAILYGIAHDLVTAHIAVGYFLPPYHDILVETDSPVLLALVWGVVATWWVGLIGGMAVAVGMRSGRLPKLEAKALIPQLAKGQIVLYLAVMLLGLSLRLSGATPISQVGTMHLASYLGGVAVIAWLFCWALPSDSSYPVRAASRHSHKTSASSGVFVWTAEIRTTPSVVSIPIA